MIDTSSVFGKKTFEDMVSPLPLGAFCRGRMNSRNDGKKWPRKESAQAELRCALDPELLKRNVETKTFFEDEQVRINGSVFARRLNFDNLKASIPVSRFNGMHIKMEDDCPQGGDDVRLCILKTLGAHDMRSIACVACLEQLTVYDRYPLLDGTFFLSSIPRRGVPSVSLLFDSRPLFIQALCARCLWADWRCCHCGSQGWFVGPSVILGTLYTFDITSVGQCCTPSCHVCSSPLVIPPHFLNQLKQGNNSLLHESLNCAACGSNEEHLCRRMKDVFISRSSSHISSSFPSPNLGSQLPVDAAIH